MFDFCIWKVDLLLLNCTLEFCLNKGTIPKHSKLIQAHNQIELPSCTPSENGKWQEINWYPDWAVVFFFFWAECSTLPTTFYRQAVLSRMVLKLSHVSELSVWLVKVQKAGPQPQSFVLVGLLVAGMGRGLRILFPGNETAVGPRTSFWELLIKRLGE